VAEQQQDVDALKRRSRRRLVGAVALVLAAVIVLPMVFDSEPRSPAPPVSVRIPGEGDTPFAPKVPAKPPAKAPAKAETPKAAFANPESVIAKLKTAKIPYYTEDLAIASGKVTRVRAGPYSSKDAAEKTAERLKGLGFKPGNVAAKAG